MSNRNQIREIAARNNRNADWRDGETMATLDEPDAIVEIHYHEPSGTQSLGLGTLSRGAQITAAMRTAIVPPANDDLGSIDGQGDGDEASIVTQFITFDVVGTRESESGWPAGTFGTQGVINPIEQRSVRSFANAND
jgi:hypothetical protein